MARYIIRRILLAFPILIGISLIVFLMLHSAGGDPAAVKPILVRELGRQLGLAPRPAPSDPKLPE